MRLAVSGVGGSVQSCRCWFLWLHVLRSVQVCTMLLPYFVVCIVVVV